MSFTRPEYLSSIDAESWPNVATVPASRWPGMKARRAEAEFAKACDDAGLELDLEAEDGPDLKVGHDALFERIAASGWLGFAESYMAGEWTVTSSSQLVKVLGRLLGAGYLPKSKMLGAGKSEPGELPLELVRLYAGDGLSHVGGIFPVAYRPPLGKRWKAIAPRPAARSRRATSSMSRR